METVEIDLGKETELAVPAAPEKKNKYFPCLYLDGIDLGDVDLPDEGQMLVTYRVKSSTHREGDNGDSDSVELEIRSIDGVEGAPEDKKTASDDFESRMKEYRGKKD
jgi:hypothetical protein